MKKIITILAAVIILTLGVIQLNVFSNHKQNIKNMLSDNKAMITTTKEGNTNIAYIKEDKVIITQDIEGANYQLTLNKDNKNIVKNIMFYMVGNNASNVEVEFYDIENINISSEGVQLNFIDNNGYWIEF